MLSVQAGYCETAFCSHECDCNCHRSAAGLVEIVHMVPCCSPCGLCHRRIENIFKDSHQEICHKPIQRQILPVPPAREL